MKNLLLLTAITIFTFTSCSSDDDNENAPKCDCAPVVERLKEVLEIEGEGLLIEECIENQEVRNEEDQKMAIEFFKESIRRCSGDGSFTEK